MKNLILTFSALMICFASSAQSTNPIEGVWKRTITYSILNDDTLNYQDSELQHIIYLDSYFMWASEPASTGEWHGFGTYELVGDSILIQTLLTMSKPMKNAMGGGNTATLSIFELTEKSYIQMVWFQTPKGQRLDFQHYIKLLSQQ